MSTENVKVFFEKVKKDAGLQKQARELPRVDPEETLKDSIEFKLPELLTLKVS